MKAADLKSGGPRYLVTQRLGESVRCAQDRFEAVGVQDKGAPVDVDPQAVEMVLTVVLMLSRHRLSLARVGSGDDDTKIPPRRRRHAPGVDFVLLCEP